MSWLAFALVSGFLVQIFPVRAAIGRARFGDAGRTRLLRRRPLGWVVADVLFLVGFALVAAGPALAALDVIGLIAEPPAGLGVAGVLIALAACALALWAQESMGRAWRTDIAPGEQAELVTSGPFAFVRNPNYVAMLALAAGTLLIATTAPGIVGAVVLLASLVLTARYEEPGLAEAYGAAYRAYAARVGRFAPRVGRLR